MGFKIKKLIKKVMPLAAPLAIAAVGGVAGAAAYQKLAPMAKSYMQNKRAAGREAEAEQAQLFPSVSQAAAAPGYVGQYPASSGGGGFWSFLAKLFGMG
jgi:hypothetical protein